MADPDSTPAIITDHPFEPVAEWYSLCKHCRLARAAHVESAIDTLAEMKADLERQRERFAEQMREASRSKIDVTYYRETHPE